MFFWLPHDDIQTYCDKYASTMESAKKIKYDVWVGEWSLATDDCATWIGGFNNVTTPAFHKCKRVECPQSYMPVHGTDFDRTAARLGPYGTEGLIFQQALIKEGMCAIDSEHFSEDQVLQLGQCLLDTFNENVEGHFMWTVRNQLEDRWSYVTAYDKGWVKNKPSNSTESIELDQ